jgi:arsenical pump membrane protein
MMALAEFAQRDGLFAWIAARAVRAAGGSRLGLLTLVYAAGVATTALFSNDATIVVLTPAVLRAVAHVDAPPFPYLAACAVVANAASFVLPISNPANLLVFAGRMPPLDRWLVDLGPAALAAVAVTFGVLAWRFAPALRGGAAPAQPPTAPPPSRAGVAVLLVAAAVVLAVSLREGPLGAAALGCGAAAWLFALVRRPADGLAIARGISWSIVPFTAALFVLVWALEAVGGLRLTAAALAWCVHLGPAANLAAGALAALTANFINNLPLALIAGATAANPGPGRELADALAVGVNLGPNAAVSGSLATILWMGILRRHGVAVEARDFLRIGLWVTPPALLAALALVH